MAKFPRHAKLDKGRTREIITDLCEAMAQTKTAAEAAEVLTDLLGRQELEMVARRLRVAELLLDDLTYQDISKDLKISAATIARVQAWLSEAGEGYRKIVKRIKGIRGSRRENARPFQPSGFKKKYPLYFWPQLVFDYWIKSSTQKQKKAMLEILSRTNDKNRLFRELTAQLKSVRISKTNGL